MYNNIGKAISRKDALKSATKVMLDSEERHAMFKKLKPPIDRKAIDAFIEDNFSEYLPVILLADGLDEAFIGISNSFTKEPCAVYSRNKCIEILEREMSHEDAVEYFEYNTEAAYVGEHTPIFVETLDA